MTASPPRCVVAIGASAGGLDALRTIVRALPAGLPAAVLVVMHLSPDRRSALPEILARSGPLPALAPHDGAPLQAGVIYVAPPDQHLMIEEGTVRIVAGPRENLQRPAVDPLFRSVARWYGVRGIAVVLSGSLDDGTSGLASIRAAGGHSIAQDPATATIDSMPANAIEAGLVDDVLPPDRIGPRIAEIVAKLAAGDEPDRVELPAAKAGAPRSSASGRRAREGQPGRGEDEKASGELRDYEWDPGAAGAVPSVFICPDCGGTLFELEQHGVLEFRCRIGHAFSAGSLDAAEDDRLEQALAVALRALEERAELSSRLRARANLDGRTAAGRTHEERRLEAEREAATIRRILSRYGDAAGESAGSDEGAVREEGTDA